MYKNQTVYSIQLAWGSLEPSPWYFDYNTFQNYSELEIPGKRFTFAIATAFQLISKVKLNTTTYGSFLEIDCLAIDV